MCVSCLSVCVYVCFLERLETDSSKSVSSEDVKVSADKLSSENRVKSEIGGGDVKAKCDVRGGDGVRVKNGGEIKVKNEASMEDNGASSTTSSSVDLAL